MGDVATVNSEQATEELPTQNPHANPNAVTEEYPAQGRQARKPRPAPEGRPEEHQARKPRPAAEERQDRTPRPAPEGRLNAVTEEHQARTPRPAAEARANAVTDEYQAQHAVPQERTDQPSEEQPKRRKGRFWRELAGALAAGLTVLALVVLVLQIISWSNGVPGLGVVELIGHIVAAGLALYAQRTIDRRPGRPALIAGLGIGVLVVLVLVLFWWI